ncbi:MAG: glycosyl hydrolase family 28 protein [Sedimentisphaerales bacterium]
MKRINVLFPAYVVFKSRYDQRIVIMLFRIMSVVLAICTLTCSCSARQPKASSAPANHDIIVYPHTSAAVKSPLYSVRVNRVPVFVEKYKDINYAHFAFSGKADITITTDKHITSYTLSPESYNIPANVEGNKLVLTINRPRKLVIRINAGERLFIFADPMETNPLKFGDSKVVNIMDFDIDNTGKILETEKIQKAIDALEKDGVLYLPPGIYQTATLHLKSNMTLYLAGGAMLRGAPSYAYYPLDNIGRRLIMIADCTDVTIKGRGIIDGNGAAVRASGERAHLVTMKNSEDILVEDVFLRESGSWNTHILLCDRVTIRNIKMINDVTLTNTDGFDPDSSNDVLIEHSFIYAGDDAVAVKTSGRGGLLRDLTKNTFRYNVVLTQKSALKIGTETRAKNMNNIRFMHNQVLQSDRAMAIYCSDGADISDISFVGNNFEENYPDNKRRMIHFQISNRKSAGQIRDVLIKNCSFKKPYPENSTIEGLDREHRIRGVKFENFSIAGRLCRDAGEANLEIEDFVEDITFEVTE